MVSMSALARDASAVQQEPRQDAHLVPDPTSVIALAEPLIVLIQSQPGMAEQLISKHANDG
jgi:hypothetical protein